MNKKIVFLGLFLVIIGLCVKAYLGTSGDVGLSDEQIVTRYCDRVYEGEDYDVKVNTEYSDCNYISYDVYEDGELLFIGSISRDDAFDEVVK